MGFACSRLLFSSLIFHFKAFPIFTPQMPLLPSLLFLAQAAIITAATPVPATALAHHGSHHRATASPTPAPSPEVRITIVNATSIPFLSLNTEGTNLPVAYPVFPQGTCTGNAPLTNPIIDYLVRNGGAIVAERRLHFQPVSSQILLLTGDLSTSGPAEFLPQMGAPPIQGSKIWPSNLQFHIYPAVKGDTDRCRYRVVNGMPSKLLILRSIAEAGQPSRQLALLAPGNSVLFIRQPRNLQWEAEIDGRIYPVTIEQENDSNNCLIPFFLRNGQPDFIRVFED